MEEIEIPKELKAGDIIRIKDKRVAIIGHGISPTSAALRQIIENTCQERGGMIIVVQEDMSADAIERIKDIANQKIMKFEKEDIIARMQPMKYSGLYSYKDRDERANQKQRGKWIR